MLATALFALFLLLIFAAVRVRFPRPYAEAVRTSGTEPALVYAVIKAESAFEEGAVSRAGAVGLMQIKPSTADFICRERGIPFEPEQLSEPNYNIRLGCEYLEYLLARFGDLRTALAAYNAGEGRVTQWLRDPACSRDGRRLHSIPFAETRAYTKKVLLFRKIYLFFYA